jgi:LuxR family maltose regulon positive regulatory protein
MNPGAADVRDGDYFGPPLNRIAHMLAAGHGGQILLSHATAEVVRDCLPPGASLVDLGAHQLKDLSRPEQIFQLVRGDLPADFPPLTTLAARPAPAAILPTNMLATKLFVPPARANLVVRPRLFERLQAGLREKLTLIAAPAGFGKTTLLSAWRATAAGSALPVGWVSLDRADNDPLRFWSYVITALDTLAPGVGTTALALLQSPQPPPTEAILTALLNDIVTIPDHFVLVLDDYHVIDAKPLDTAMTFLLEHLPPQLHLVIATRENPSLPLARLRARGHLTELRAADLRFTPAEAAAFLTQAMGLNLAAEAIAALERRTEGWIAGLQLAALSMQGHKDAASFIQSFTGSHHFVLDYLLEEVLHQQPESVQMFLLRTSILDRLCGPLCDAVLRDPAASGQATLNYIEHANLFIIPLDNERRWYRYHHLFADLLRQRLQQSAGSFGREAARDVAELHTRASIWYEEHGLELEAFHHATLANDVARAERLMEGKGMPLHYRGALAPILNWLKSLPTTVLDARPSLWVMYASAVTMVGQPVSSVEQKLQAAEAALQDAEPDDKARDLVGQVAATRAMLAIPQNQVETMVAQSRRALEYLHPNNLPVRTAAMWTLGYAYQLQGDRAAAIRAYTEAIASSQASGNIMITIAATTCLGQVQESENQLALAAESYQRVLQLAGDPPMPAVCEAHLGLARICYEWNDLDAAQQHGQASAQLAPQIETTDTPAACGMLLARLKLALGDVAGAAVLLAKAEQFVRQHHFAHRMPEVAAVQVLTLLRQGNLAAAAQLAQAHELPMSQARVHLAQGDPSTALALLEPLRRQAEAKGWADEQLKVIVLQAIALFAHGKTGQAIHLLKDALALAAPGGFVRIFVDEGAPMAQLLTGMQDAGGTMHEYMQTLLVAFGAQPDALPAASHPQPLAEPLSQRELEVLRLVSQGLSNREISTRLVLALDTVKGHNRRIYEKLQVQRRTEAVARARELGLL